jgi:hypothetical protein
VGLFTKNSDARPFEPNGELHFVKIRDIRVVSA